MAVSALIYGLILVVAVLPGWLEARQARRFAADVRADAEREISRLSDDACARFCAGGEAEYLAPESHPSSSWMNLKTFSDHPSMWVHPP